MTPPDSSPAKAHDAHERLLETERELNEILYAVSHDMRAPLRSIQGFAGALKEDFSGKLDPRADDYLARICKSAQVLERMMHGVVAISRLNRMPLTIVHENLSATCTDIFHGLIDADPNRTVAIRVTPGIETDTDRKLLRIALEAVIGNAWKFTAETASPSIRVTLRREPSGDLRIIVEDNGTGFDTQAAGSRIFGLFQRFHHKDSHTGGGVGLATAQRAIHRLGGTIAIESTPGTGTAVTIVLPAEVDPIRRTPPAEPAWFS